MIAAGRPASALSASPLLFFERLRAIDAARGQMRHQAEEERQVVLGDALFIQRQDEIAGVVCSRKLEFSTPSAMPL